MAIYLVTYDLNKETTRPKIVDEVRKTGYARLSESSYAIDTQETPQQVYNRFLKLLDNNDDFYVILLKRPYSGQGSQEVNDWLESNLPW
jgi:CRISPR/Cas system-associated endoribonuclease Cas2